MISIEYNLRDIPIINHCFKFQDSPPAATDENEADESKDAGSVKGMDDGMPVEVVNQQCCTGSKACLILQRKKGKKALVYVQL